MNAFNNSQAKIMSAPSTSLLVVTAFFGEYLDGNLFETSD